MQAVKLSGTNKNPVVLRSKELRRGNYRLSDEMKEDLNDVREGRNLIGPFDNLDDLWRELGV